MSIFFWPPTSWRLLKAKNTPQRPKMASRSQFIEKSFLMKVAQQPQKPPNRSNHQKFLCQIEETMLIVKEKSVLNQGLKDWNRVNRGIHVYLNFFFAYSCWIKMETQASQILTPTSLTSILTNINTYYQLRKYVIHISLLYITSFQKIMHFFSTM